jgi:hypothetical protein
LGVRLFALEFTVNVTVAGEEEETVPEVEGGVSVSQGGTLDIE